MSRDAILCRRVDVCTLGNWTNYSVDAVWTLWDILYWGQRDWDACTASDKVFDVYTYCTTNKHITSQSSPQTRCIGMDCTKKWMYANGIRWIRNILVQLKGHCGILQIGQCNQPKLLYMYMYFHVSELLCKGRFKDFRLEPVGNFKLGSHTWHILHVFCHPDPDIGLTSD